MARRRPFEERADTGNIRVPGKRISPSPRGFTERAHRLPRPRARKRQSCEIGPGKVAAFIFEPVVGASGGAVPCPPGYAQKVREICDRYGVLMIADEVMCGIGRCGSWRALALEDGCEPDIMTIAKGMGGGFMPSWRPAYTGRVSMRRSPINTGRCPRCITYFRSYACLRSWPRCSKCDPQGWPSRKMSVRDGDLPHERTAKTL